MTEKIKVGAVSYLNTKPLIYGMEKGLMSDQVILSIDYPSKIARDLLDRRIDLGLVPVAIIPQLPQSFIITDYCIGCNGAVGSVSLFSKVPLTQIKTIVLDYQSRTSVALLQLLLKYYWQVEPELVPGEPGYEKNITGTTAALVIGDRTFEFKKQDFFDFDLGDAWKQWTGKPFVFAAWIANKNLDPGFVKLFNKANRYGLDHLNEVVQQNQLSGIDLMSYYTKNLDYNLDSEKREALQLFLEKIKAEQQTL